MTEEEPHPDVWDVKRVALTETMLFRLDVVVDELRLTDPQIANNGFFLGLLEEDMPAGSGIDVFITKLKNHYAYDEDNKRKRIGFQVPIEFPHCRELLGHRQIKYSDGDDDTESEENFLKMLKDPQSYGKPNCCSKILESEGPDALLDHLFDALHAAAQTVENPLHSKIDKKRLCQRGEKDAKMFMEFRAKFEDLSPQKKNKEVLRLLKRDKRNENEGCSDRQCVIDDDEKVTKGIWYASGISMKDTECYYMTPNFTMTALGQTSLLRYTNVQYTGISRPMLYYSSKHSFAAAHYEDMSLFSINFLHHGSPKLWIVVPPHAVTQLRDAIMADYPNIYHSGCPNVLGHKYFVPTKKWLVSKNIPYKVVIQRERQAVVLYPNAVHWVLNLGTCVCEAANFSSRSWVPFGLAALRCHCSGGEVHVQMHRIVAATFPEWLDCLEKGVLPSDAPEKTVPDFFQCIVRDAQPKMLMAQDTNDKRRDKRQLSDTEDEDEDEPFDAAQLPTNSGKDYSCPKKGCNADYRKGRNVVRLKEHVTQKHSHDGDFPKYLKKLEERFPPRNKTTKQECNLCGTPIAGSSSNLKKHQAGSNCIPKE